MNPLKTLCIALIAFVVAACDGIAIGDSNTTFCVEQRDFPPEYTTPLDEAAAEWNDTVGTNLAVKHGGCEGLETRIRTGNVSPHLAVTRMNKGDTPTEIIIEPNNSNLTEVRSTFLHEIGHVLGLGHSTNPLDIMYVNSQFNGHLTQGDIDAYWAIRNGVAPESPVTSITQP
jgi:hypothetical protein